MYVYMHAHLLTFTEHGFLQSTCLVTCIAIPVSHMGRVCRRGCCCGEVSEKYNFCITGEVSQHMLTFVYTPYFSGHQTHIFWEKYCVSFSCNLWSEAEKYFSLNLCPIVLLHILIWCILCSGKCACVLHLHYC
jgi:hypothetical protein